MLPSECVECGMRISSLLPVLTTAGFLALTFLVECAPPPPGPVARARGAFERSHCDPAALKGLPLGARLSQWHKTCGSLLVVASSKGLQFLTPPLGTVAHPITQRVSSPRVVGQQLFYFQHAKRQLRSLDLRRGQDTGVATLPVLTESCFQQTNPLDHVYGMEDFSVDPKKGFACLNVVASNANMGSMIFNYRIDLESGQVDERLIQVGGECQAIRRGKQKAACIPEPSQRGAREVVVPLRQRSKGLPGIRSPSGRWVITRDYVLGAQADDYIYSAPLLYDTHRKVIYAIGSKSLLQLDDARLRSKMMRMPAEACILPKKGFGLWLPNGEHLLLQGCGAGGYFLVIDLSRKIPTFRSLKVDELTVY